MRGFTRVLLTLILASSVIPAPSYAASDTCLVDGAILSLSEECLNDLTALIVDSTKVNANGWQYAYDHLNDGSGGDEDDFNIFGIALKITQNDIYFVINGNLPITGFPYQAPNVPDGIVGWGDLFIDNSNSGTFQNASALSKLLGIHFVPDGVPSDSGAPGPGLYSSVTAKTTVDVNAGYASLNDYEQHELSFGVTPNMADLPFTQTYYLKTSALNAILTGNLLGNITYITMQDLLALGYDPTQYPGTSTIAFKITKNLICDVCGVFGGDGTSCLDCAGIPFGGKTIDACGVCGGNGTSCNPCGDGTMNCLDCKGVPNGPAKLDSCGVCNGDGQSCISCEGTDNTQDQFAMDTLALRLKNNVDAIMRLYRAYGIDNASSRAAKIDFHAAASSLYTIAWAHTWDFPRITNKYKGTGQTHTHSNSSILNSYNDSIKKLYDLNRKAANKIRKDSKKKNAGRKLLNRAGKVKSEALKIAADMPATTDDCPGA